MVLKGRQFTIPQGLIGTPCKVLVIERCSKNTVFQNNFILKEEIVFDGELQRNSLEGSICHGSQ